MAADAACGRNSRDLALSPSGKNSEIHRLRATAFNLLFAEQQIHTTVNSGRDQPTLERCLIDNFGFLKRAPRLCPVPMESFHLICFICSFPWTFECHALWRRPPSLYTHQKNAGELGCQTLTKDSGPTHRIQISEARWPVMTSNK